MKPYPSSQPPTVFQRYAAGCWQSPRAIGIAVLAAIALMNCAQAQVQTAGTVFINVDATTLANGTLTDITNSGSLGGYFEATNSVLVTNMTVGGATSLFLGGIGTTNHLRLVNGIGGALIPPPDGLVGTNATCSIEVWAFKPAVVAEEPMVAWGARTNGQSMVFDYGSGASGGAQHVGADIQWDPIGTGCPVNNNWHYLVYTYDGTNQNLYADGTLANRQPVSFVTATNAGIALGAQWGAAGTNISITNAWATLALARVRVHDGALTPAQVLNNFNFEKGTFITTVPQFLTYGPVHRYSFSEPATEDATGRTFFDSIGTAHGTVQSSEQNQVARFSGRRLILPGGIQTATAGYGAPYGDLPNGLFSSNSTNNGGSGELSIEIWYKNTGSAPWSSPRVFEAGSCGAGQGPGQEVTGPGGFPAGGGLDYFDYAGQVGTTVNQRRLQWQNKDVSPGGSTTNRVAVSSDVFTMNSYQTDLHMVVTWNENTGLVKAYENGLFVASINVSNAMSALNDVNIWLGRSVNSTNDAVFAGEYDEVRFYTNVLTPGQVLGDFQVGPNTINTGEQAVAISVQPQNATVNQGWPATFYVTASGSPAVAYQWSRNGTPISGATSDTYMLASVASGNNGDTYSCLVSNFAGAVPNTLTSSAATLTVAPNVAAAAAVLHETKDATPTFRDNFNGVVGTLFQVGSAGAFVTHLGYYDVFNDGLNHTHNVGIFSGNGSVILGSVLIPAGGDPSTYVTNGYRYLALNPPLMLAPNTSYILEGEAFNAIDNDPWADIWAPGVWNPYFVGTNGPSTRQGRFGGVWPAPATSGSTANSAYSPPNMATLPIGPAQVWTQQTNVIQYVGLPVTLSVLANGQAPLSLQWYKAPATLLPGQNGLSLAFPNPATTDSGDYYVVLSNALALGGVQSSNITLSVLVNSPVSITAQPTNATVPEGFSVGFSITASGTPPISYQWRRNGTPLSGATNTAYSIAVASMTNNGDIYSCIVSNNTTGPHTVTSDPATLTVQPNRAPLMQVLYPAIGGFRDDFNGVVGGQFQVGASPAVVTHLGYFSSSGTLQNGHHVGIFPTGGGNTPIASVVVPGATSYFLNGYLWVALDAPLTLAANTSYILAAEVFAFSGDPWPDVFAPAAWNSYYVGTNGSSTRVSKFTGSFWPTTPASGAAANQIYGAPNLAILPVGPPVVTMQQTNVIQYVGASTTLLAFVDGEPPVTVQWYKAPNTLLNGQTNLSLILPSLAPGDGGDYYLIANNNLASTQGSNATLTVIAQAPPTIIQQPQSQTVYIQQQVTFTVAVSVAPLNYQWSLNGVSIPGATNSTLTLASVTAGSAGNYRVGITNSFGGTNSDIAVLTVLTPAAGSYLAAVLNANPAVYYRFSDVTNGGSAYNAGSRGAAYNGTYEGSFIDAPGPQPPDFPNFENTNMSLSLDGSTVDVSIPAFNLPTSSGPNLTLAAWIKPNGPQAANAGIIFSRATVASGLGIKPDSSTGTDMLEYHWNSLYFQSNSFLHLPVNQWAFVALSIAPAQAIIYLHDGNSMATWTNNSPHAALPFDNTSYVGYDNNSNSRRFNGQIDEAMIFGRTLSYAEVAHLYQAALLGLQITINQSGGNVIVSWPAGTLQQADTVAGPYTDMTGVTSPYTNAPIQTMKFYRVKVQ